MEDRDTVLLVDDDTLFTHSAQFLLDREGFRVVVASTGEAALVEARRHRPNLVLLDIGLPDLSGFEVCRQLRTFSTVPIIFLTARQDEVDKVVGLDLGGDDYVTKPFGAAELAARVRAVLRRSRLAAAAPQRAKRMEVGDLVIDTTSHRAWLRGQDLALTPKEFALLELLAANLGRALSRQYILDAVWGADFFGDLNALDVYISHLRRKIEPNPAQPSYIQTVRGVGYRFEDPSGHAHEPPH